MNCPSARIATTLLCVVLGAASMAAAPQDLDIDRPEEGAVPMFSGSKALDERKNLLGAAARAFGVQPMTDAPVYIEIMRDKETGQITVQLFDEHPDDVRRRLRADLDRRREQILKQIEQAKKDGGVPPTMAIPKSLPPPPTTPLKVRGLPGLRLDAAINLGGEWLPIDKTRSNQLSTLTLRFNSYFAELRRLRAQHKLPEDLASELDALLEDLDADRSAVLSIKPSRNGSPQIWRHRRPASTDDAQPADKQQLRSEDHTDLSVHLSSGELPPSSEKASCYCLASVEICQEEEDRIDELLGWLPPGWWIDLFGEPLVPVDEQDLALIRHRRIVRDARKAIEAEHAAHLRSHKPAPISATEHRHPDCGAAIARAIDDFASAFPDTVSNLQVNLTVTSATIYEARGPALPLTAQQQRRLDRLVALIDIEYELTDRCPQGLSPVGPVAFSFIIHPRRDDLERFVDLPRLTEDDYLEILDSLMGGSPPVAARPSLRLHRATVRNRKFAVGRPASAPEVATTGPSGGPDAFALGIVRAALQGGEAGGTPSTVERASTTHANGFPTPSSGGAAGAARDASIEHTSHSSSPR